MEQSNRFGVPAPKPSALPTESQTDIERDEILANRVDVILQTNDQFCKYLLDIW